MNIYIKTIKFIQKYLLVFSVILFLMIMPSLISFHSELFSWEVKSHLFQISLLSVIFVMSIRPLADIFPEYKFIRPLVILRKSFGVLSASIIIGFLLEKVISSGGVYFYEFLTLQYWSMEKYALLAHLGDITGFILLITSNNLSKQILGRWWRMVQKLSYVYFCSGAFYELFALQQVIALWGIILVSSLVTTAFIINLRKNMKKYENN